MPTSNPRLQKKVRRFLTRHSTCVVATTDGTRPYAATVHYAMNGLNKLYFITATKTKKFDNLTKNPNVSIVIGAGPKIKSIQLAGTARFIFEETEEELRTIQQLPAIAKSKYRSFVWAFRPDLQFTIVEVNITWMRYLTMRSFPRRKSVFYEVSLDD